MYSDFSLHYCPRFVKTGNTNVEESIAQRVNHLFADYYEQSVSDSRRLFYVGLTRARDYLVTLSTNGKKQDFFDELGYANKVKGVDDGTDAKSKFYAGKYGPQLNAYRRGLENQGTKVLDTLIFYSVQGRLVRVL